MSSTATDITPPAEPAPPRPWAAPPLVRGDDKKEFDLLLATLRADVAPRGAVEEMYVSEIAGIVWEMLRLQRCRAAAVNAVFHEAVGDLTRRLMIFSGEPAESEQYQEVLTLLRRYELDETAIEAEAMHQKRYYLEEMEKRQAALAARRDKALCCIAACRANLARDVRASADRILAESAPTAADDEYQLRRRRDLDEFVRRSVEAMEE